MEFSPGSRCDQVNIEKAYLWNKAQKEAGTRLGLRVGPCLLTTCRFLIIICPPAAQVRGHRCHRKP